jgi:ubiquinone/menaquinone biosynthesis C-methylase UbiE
VDREPSMVERAGALAEEHQVAHVRFQVGDLCDLPFPASSFDAVFTCAVLEHLAEPVQAAGVLFTGSHMGLDKNNRLVYYFS